MKTFVTTHASITEANCSHKGPVKIVWQRGRNFWAKWSILLDHKQSSSFPMGIFFVKIKSTTCRIIDGLHAVQRSHLVSSRLYFSKLWCFGDLSCEGDVMPPHFFREGLRLNSDAYVELLITVVKPWITRVANGRSYVWQQDSAPCHTAGKRKKCRRIFKTTPVPMFGL